MSRRGNLSELEQRLAARRREDERLARERKRQEREQEQARQQDKVESAQQDAQQQTAAVQEQLKSLDEVLTSVLALPPVSFDRLMATPRTPPFDPGPLGVPLPAPDWSDFAPPRPGLLRLLLGGAARHKRQTAQAQGRFEAAAAEHREHESQRQKDLAVAKARYHGKLTEERARAVARNAYVARRESAFGAGDAEAVAWFARCVLKASRYPDGFPRAYQVAYHPGDRKVAVDFELPPLRVVPSVRTYRYVQARGAVEPVPRPEHEIRQRYDRLIACVALRTLHEIFSATAGATANATANATAGATANATAGATANATVSADAPDVVQAVSFTGYVSTTDRATGKPIRPHLLSVSAERPVFEDLVLAAVEPAACLAALGAQTPADARLAERARGR